MVPFTQDLPRKDAAVIASETRVGAQKKKKTQTSNFASLRGMKQDLPLTPSKFI